MVYVITSTKSSSELAVNSTNMKMEMETAAYHKFMWQKNAGLPLKKRFSPLMAWQANSVSKERRIISEPKEKVVNKPYIAVDRLNCSSTISNVNEDVSDDLYGSAIAELREAVCDAVRKWRRSYDRASLIPSSTIVRTLQAAATAEYGKGILKTPIKMFYKENIDVMTPTTPIMSSTPIGPLTALDYSDKENMNPSRRYEDSDSDEEQIPMELLKSNRKPGMVPIGDGFAWVPASLLRRIDWNSYTIATRKLLLALFPRSVLSTHSLTGKRSPAFPHLPPKKKLPVGIVNDIIQTVVERCGVSASLVRLTCACEHASLTPPWDSSQRQSQAWVKEERSTT